MYFPLKNIIAFLRSYEKPVGDPLPAHLLLRVVQTRAHGKILVIFDKNRVLLAKNRRATNNEYGANLQHVKRGAQEGGRRRVFIPP
jgi:hypothetical protein